MAQVEGHVCDWILWLGGKPPKEEPPNLGGEVVTMRFGNWEVRPLGGGFGCLVMILVSVVLSVIGTIVLNLLFH